MAISGNEDSCPPSVNVHVCFHSLVPVASWRNFSCSTSLSSGVPQWAPMLCVGVAFECTQSESCLLEPDTVLLGSCESSFSVVATPPV